VFSDNAAGAHRVSVSMVAGFDLGKLSTKCARDCSESQICTSKCYKTEAFGALLADEIGKMCDCSESSICTSKSEKKRIGALLEDNVGKMRTRL
jgi:hypothetical protein